MSFGTPTPLQYSSRDKLFQIAPEYISYCLLLCTTSSSTYFRALKTLLLLHRTTRKTDNARALRKSYAVKTVFAPRPHDGFSSDCRYVNLALCVCEYCYVKCQTAHNNSTVVAVALQLAILTLCLFWSRARTVFFSTTPPPILLQHNFSGCSFNDALRLNAH